MRCHISWTRLFIAVAATLLAYTGVMVAQDSPDEIATAPIDPSALQCQDCQFPNPNDDPGPDPKPKPKTALELKIDPLIWAQMQKRRLPGVAVAITRGGTQLFNKGYGYASTKTQKPMTAVTRTRVGSLSKTITGAAGFQLMQAKGIDPQTKLLYGATGVFGNDFAGDIDRGIKRFTPIVGIDIGAGDHVFTWYNNGTVSEGATNNLGQYAAPKPYTLPPKRVPVDIRGIAIASNGMVYTWYDDARTKSTDSPTLTRSIGTITDLDQFDPETTEGVKLPKGKTSHDIVGIAIAKSNDHVYAWYQDGTRSEGTSMDFDAYDPPKPFTVATKAGGTSFDLRELAIAGNDHVYAWFGNGFASSGMSHKLDQYLAPYAFSVPSLTGGNDWNNWYATMTVQNLLDHEVGFTRSGDVPAAAKMFDTDEDHVSYKQIHQHFLRTRRLLRAPGGDDLYSNHGFGLWTLLIDKMSNQSYRNYVQNSYLAPAGVSKDVIPQGATPNADGRDADNHVLNGDDMPVPIPFEASNHGLAAGGYRATARALLTLTAKLDGKYSDADLDRMGWGKADDGRLQHNGGIEGGMAYVVMFPAGYTTKEGLDLSHVHIAIVANHWNNVGELSAVALEIAKQLPPPP